MLLKQAIAAANTTLFGLFGAAIDVDVLAFSSSSSSSSSSCSAVIRVPAASFERVTAAMALYGSHNNNTCRFEVGQRSPSLIGLGSDSRLL